MNRKQLNVIALVIFLVIYSCDEPETVLTNIVHSDGSVTREIVMKSHNEKAEDRFRVDELQLPIDDTWNIRDSAEIDDKGDTTWVRRAVKHFSSVADINSDYKSDSGSNKEIKRQAEFKKTFKWFNTQFRFSETIEPTLSYGYPVGDFLNKEELYYFYSPEFLKNEKQTGSDSLKYRALNDSVNKKTEFWGIRNLVSVWIAEFSKLIEGTSAGRETIDSIKAHENDIFEIVQNNDAIIDSLWSNGIILKKFIGDDSYQKFRLEADSATESAFTPFFMDFKEYTTRISMPGVVIATNGYIDSSKLLLWPVKSDYFLTERYDMWAESKIPNIWAWIVSGIFVAFVISGLILRIMKEGRN